MGGEGKSQRRSRSGAPIGLHVEVAVVDDPALRRRQLKAIRNFLVTLAGRVGDSGTSDVRVGGGTARVDGLEVLMGPLEADVVRVLWAAKAPVSVREGLRELNGNRSRPLGHTTVQTVMTRLTRKHVLARSRQGRADLYRAVLPDAADIAVSRLLAEFGEAAIEPFVEQVCREPRLRSVFRDAGKKGALAHAIRAPAEGLLIRGEPLQGDGVPGREHPEHAGGAIALVEVPTLGCPPGTKRRTAIATADTPIVTTAAPEQVHGRGSACSALAYRLHHLVLMQLLL